ncbi:MAG: glycosyltransferase, partial [Alphaproteobacteria bacterium]|nr:glycosyltransferase [Alphaproteobacteria bacterium]
MKNAKISVIVPVYNQEKYLKQCIDSIINQTYKNLEIILVDDGSTDTSPQICDDYSKKDKRIKVIHQTNGRQGKARNTGIKAATGDYIGFVDSDDWIETPMFEKLLNAIEKNNADISMCDYIRGNKHNHKSRIDSILLNKKVFDLKTLNPQPQPRKMFFGMAVCWNKLFKADLAKKYLIFPENLFFEDTPAVFDTLIHSSKITVIDKNLYHYRVNDMSTTRISNDSKSFDLIKVQQIIINNMKKYDYKNFSNFVIPAITYDLIRRLKFINSDILKGYYIETIILLKQFNTSKYKIKPKY